MAAKRKPTDTEAPLVSVKVISRIDDGEVHDVGETIEVTEKEADALEAAGAAVRVPTLATES